MTKLEKTVLGTLTALAAIMVVSAETNLAWLVNLPADPAEWPSDTPGLAELIDEASTNGGMVARITPDGWRPPAETNVWVQTNCTAECYCRPCTCAVCRCTSADMARSLIPLSAVTNGAPFKRVTIIPYSRTAGGGVAIDLLRAATVEEGRILIDTNSTPMTIRLVGPCVNPGTFTIGIRR